MALGKNNSDYNGGNLIILRPITRDADKHDIPATFQVTRKNDAGEWQKDEDTVASVTGDLVKVETYENIWEGKKTYGFKLLLKDEEAKENYLIDTRLNILSRDLANKILGLTSFENVTIGLFKNKKGFNSSSVKVGQDLVKWKFEFSDIPKPDEIINPRTNEVVQRDYTSVDEFFINALDKFSQENSLVGKSKEEKKTNEVKESPSEEKGGLDPDDEDFFS